MEHYQKIPEDLYGHWYGVVTKEYGEIIQSQTETGPEAAQSENLQEGPQSGRQQLPKSMQQTTSSNHQAQPIQLKQAFVSRSRTNQRPSKIKETPTTTKLGL